VQKVVLEHGARKHLRKTSATRITEGGGDEALSFPTDVRRREDLDNLVAIGFDRFGRLDVLVEIAGIGTISRLDELRVADWRSDR